MAEQLKLFRLAGLEDWRIKAFNLGGPLGHVFSRTFELMHTVIRDGTGNEQSVGYAMESLSRERELALSRDENGDDPVNTLIYGVADNLKVMMDSILEEKRPDLRPVVEEREERPQPSSSSSEDTLPHLRVPKEEPLFMPLAPKEDPQEMPSASKTPQTPAQKPIVQRETQQHTSTSLPQKRPLDGPSSAAMPPPLKRLFETPTAPRTAPATPAPAVRTVIVPPPVRPTVTAVVTPATRLLATTPAAPLTVQAVRAAAAAAIANLGGKSAPPGVCYHMCDTCGKSFESDKGLQRHAFIHNAEKCTVCRKFINPTKMKSHMAQYHNGKRRSTKKGWDRDSDDDEGVYERRPRTPSVDTASVVSGATTVAYKTPGAVSTPTRPPASGHTENYSCDKCDKSFDTLAGLRRHEYVHDVVKCPICARDIAKTRMDGHLRSHEQDGRLAPKDRIDCPISNCEAYRNSPSMMKDHLRVTHGVKPYACETCEDSFFMKTDLVKHKLVCGNKETATPIERENSPEV